MASKVSLDLRVHPDNPNVTVHHFLVRIAGPTGVPIGYMMFSQAWTGKWSDKKEQRAWNSISTRLEELSYHTGLEYSIEATGSEEFCKKHMKKQGLPLLA